MPPTAIANGRLAQERREVLFMSAIYHSPTARKAFLCGLGGADSGG